MPTLNETLKNNIFADIIIPVIKEYNKPKIEANPFELLAIGYILRQKSRNWGQSGTGDPGDTQRKPCIDCYCGLTWMGRKCGCSNASSCCPSCNNSSNTSKSIGPELTRNLLTQLSRDARMGNPWTAFVLEFEKKVESIITSLPNAWVFFQQIVDVFYEYTNFIKFFCIDYENGRYRDYVLPTFLDGLFREGARPAGLLFQTTTQGDDAATAATTIINVDIYQVGDDSTYWEIYSDTANRWIYWMDFTGGGIAPVLAPIGGITDHYVELTLDLAAPPATMATNIANALNLSVGYAFAPAIAGVDGSGDSIVIITTIGTGAGFPTSVSGLPAHGLWGLTFADGVDGIATSEVTEINFEYATATDLQNTYFILFNGTEGHMFYYTVNAGETPPAPVALTKNEILINIDDDSNAILTATDAIITGTGLFTTAQTGIVLEVTTVAQIDSTDVDKGTSEVGIISQTLNLVAPDGTDFGGSYNDDLDYARAWNTTVVSHMLSVGGPVYYLKPLRIKGIVCCCEDPICTSGGSDCRECGSNLIILSLMQRTVYPAITQDLRFNTPGTTNFVGPKSIDINL